MSDVYPRTEARWYGVVLLALACTTPLWVAINAVKRALGVSGDV